MTGQESILVISPVRALALHPEGNEEPMLISDWHVARSDLSPRRSQHCVWRTPHPRQAWPLSWGTAAHEPEVSSKWFYLSEHQCPHLQNRDENVDPPWVVGRIPRM